MTDKQIIIDDQKETIHRLQQECTEKTDTIIALGEQLKAKEQECEELKEEALHSDYGIMKNNLEGAITYLEKENKDLSKIIDCKNETVLSLKQQLDQLKAEKEEIKKYLGISSKTIMERLEELQEFRDNDKYKLYLAEQTLTEIKEIAKNSCCLQPTSTCEEYENCKECSRTSDDVTVQQILQKINEVEECKP